MHIKCIISVHNLPSTLSARWQDTSEDTEAHSTQKAVKYLITKGMKKLDNKCTKLNKDFIFWACIKEIENINHNFFMYQRMPININRLQTFTKFSDEIPFMATG